MNIKVSKGGLFIKFLVKSHKSYFTVPLKGRQPSLSLYIILLYIDFCTS